MEITGGRFRDLVASTTRFGADIFFPSMHIAVCVLNAAPFPSSHLELGGPTVER